MMLTCLMAPKIPSRKWGRQSPFTGQVYQTEPQLFQGKRNKVWLQQDFAQWSSHTGIQNLLYFSTGTEDTDGACSTGEWEAPSAQQINLHPSPSLGKKLPLLKHRSWLCFSESSCSRNSNKAFLRGKKVLQPPVVVSACRTSLCKQTLHHHPQTVCKRHSGLLNSPVQ